MPFIGRKRVFKGPLASILNFLCVARKVPLNCQLQMILQNQFEYSSLRHVSMPMAKSFGPTELPTFNNTFVLTITTSPSPPLVQNLTLPSQIPLMQPVYMPFEFRVPFITPWEAFYLTPAKDLDLYKFLCTTPLNSNYNPVRKLICI